MFEKLGFLVIVSSLVSCGCGQNRIDPSESLESQDQAHTHTQNTEQPSLPFPLDTQGKLEFFELTGKNYGNIQHRYPRIVVSDPQSKEQVLEAARIAYDAMAADIQATNPDAKYKRISMLIYDSGDEADFHQGHICIVESSNGATATLADFDDATVQWYWRLPEYRPSSEDRSLFLDYSRRIWDTDESIDSDEALTRQHRDMTINRLINEYDLSRETLIRKLSYVAIWRFGNTPSPEAVEERVTTYESPDDETPAE